MPQLDIFADTTQGKVADTVAADLEEKRQLSLLRHTLFNACRDVLSAEGVYGYPNLIRNPAGPWRQWRGAGATPAEHGLCWPGYYHSAIVSGGLNRITVLFKTGQRRNPAIVRAIKLLGGIAPVAVQANTGPAGALQYY